MAAAQVWRQESQVALRRGVLRAVSPLTLSQAAEEWFAAAEAGVVRTRSGDAYKPSALRAYRQALRATLLPALGEQRLSAITSNRLQELADELAAAGLSPSTVRNTLMPLRAIYRRALRRGDVAVNPTVALLLPAVRARRERIARPDEVAALLAALPPPDRALWAIAFYSGLRLGEIQALDWCCVDFDAGLIRVERGWDRIAGSIEPKSRSGRRRVPIAETLRLYLLSHRLLQEAGGRGPVFPNARGGRPFNPGAVKERACACWAAARLEPLTLHDCRHTYASFMIAAGVNAKALCSYMGHSSITVTLDRYGHLLPGNEQEAAARLDRWLQDAARTAP